MSPRRHSRPHKTNQTRVTGPLEMTRSGDGWLRGAADGRDVFVLRRYARNALPGDTVNVRIYTPRRQTGSDLMGKVVDVVQRRSHEVVGVLKRGGSGWHVVPSDSSYRHVFRVSKTRGGKEGDRVVVGLSSWPENQRDPEGEIRDVIGPLMEPSLDTVAICRQYGFETEFSGKIVRAAQEAAGRMESQGKRLDLRKTLVLTVDPVTARDYDDALSLETNQQGERVLGVHIADVSHFVVQDSVLDREARRRGNSVYLPDRTIPMLPEQLSNGVCSLRPDEDRLAFSAFLTLDAQNQVIKREFAKTLIRSQRRLTYEQALQILENPKQKGKIETLVRSLHAIAQEFRQRRFSRYALELDIPESKLVLDDSGRMTGLELVENDISHQMIEECMLAANEAVARELSDRGVAFISRIHPEPTDEQIETLKLELADMGYQTGDLRQRKELARFLASIKDHALAHHVRIAVLRSLNKAVYSDKPTGHYGLAKKFYAHFTSPIRRYPDLVVHRQLAAVLDRQSGSLYGAKRLKAIALDCSLTEQAAMEAERAVVAIKKLRFLKEQMMAGKGDVYDAVVVKVARFGLFVEVPQLLVQGLVHTSTFGAQHRMTGKRDQGVQIGKKDFRMGTKIRVLVERVDLEHRKVDFALVEA